jgi:hypothetical protein
MMVWAARLLVICSVVGAYGVRCGLGRVLDRTHWGA